MAEHILVVDAEAVVRQIRATHRLDKLHHLSAVKY